MSNLTTREEFIKAAMQGLLANSATTSNNAMKQPGMKECFSIVAISIADAVLAKAKETE